MSLMSVIGAGAGYALGGPTGALIGGTLGGGIDAGNAAQSAADTQVAGADRASQLQYKMWQEQQAMNKPWLEAGGRALTKLEGAVDYTPFSYDKMTADPGYAFRLSEGQKALDNQAAARGGLISGNALKAATAYGQNMGSQEYTNAFNRYQTERQAKLGPLQSLAGVGQTTAAGLGQAGQNYANNVGQNYLGAANAQAAGQVGSANAWNQALGQTGSMYMQNQMLNQLGQNQLMAGLQTPGGIAKYFGGQ